MTEVSYSDSKETFPLVLHLLFIPCDFLVIQAAREMSNVHPSIASYPLPGPDWILALSLPNAIRGTAPTSFRDWRGGNFEIFTLI